MRKILLVLATLILPTCAMAGFIIQTGNVPGADNVLLTLDETGLTIYGSTDGGTTQNVKFTGNEQLIAEANGQAVIGDFAGDGYGYLKIDLTDPSEYFNKIVFNLYAIEDGDATIKIYGKDSITASLTGTFGVGDNGANWFTAYSTASDFIDYVTVEADIDVMKQFRIAILEAAPVPEPATMLLLGVGLIGLAGYGRKKLN